ncbi:MAG TPA: DNA polymerase IV [Myxococcota bacterium]
MTRKIIHVDMDAFYASVEQRDDVALRGRPIAVVDARGWGIVATASYEARAFGVRAGTAVNVARRACRDLVVVPARMPVYEAIAEQARAIAERYTDLVEPVMLDELYLDVTATIERGGAFTTATALAHDLRARIKDELGLVVSAGVSYNKLLAKLASDESKPDGFRVIRPDVGAAHIAQLPIEKLHGIGRATQAKLAQLGVTTAATLATVALDELVAHFGHVQGHALFDLARGIDERPVKVPGPKQSHGVERSFKQALVTDDDKDRGLRAIVAEVWAKCEQHGVRGRTVSVRVKYADQHLQMKTRTSPQPLSSCAELEAAAFAVRALLPVCDDDVRSIGVSLGGFEGTAAASSSTTTQLSLLS